MNIDKKKLVRKHAYLIMVHNEPEIFKILISIISVPLKWDELNN
mgnify:CR=1 FL=1